MSRVIAAMVELVVRCCDPQEVLVFGSYAKSRQRVDSDVDLLVLCEARDPRALEWEIADLLAGFPVDVDVLVRPPGSMAAAWVERGSFMQSILSSARPVFVRSGVSVLQGLRPRPRGLTNSAPEVQLAGRRNL